MKANVVANKLEEGSTDDTVIAIAMIERHVLALSGVSIELTTESLQTWTTAYKEDNGHIVVYIKLRQGQKYEDFYLTPSRLMTRMIGVNRRS